MSCPDINPNIKDSLQETPLHYAARWGNVEECKVMLDKGRKLQNKINLEVSRNTMLAELQIRLGFENNSGIIFLIFLQKHNMF